MLVRVHDRDGVARFALLMRAPPRRAARRRPSPHLVACGDVGAVALARGLDDRQRQAVPALEPDDGLEVLQELARVALRLLEVPRQHLRIDRLQEDAVGGTAGEALRQALRLDAGGLSQHHGLRHQHVAGADDGLVDDLGGLPRPDRAHVGEVGREVVHDRPDRRHVLVAPPAITVMVPARAAPGPPDTGASTQAVPVASRSSSAIARVASGSAVERSMTVRGARDAAATPSGARTQRRTASVCSTQIRTMSLASATAAGLSRGTAPWGTTVVQPLGLLVPHADRVAALEEAQRHRLAHQPDADEAEPRLCPAHRAAHCAAPWTRHGWPGATRSSGRIKVRADVRDRSRIGAERPGRAMAFSRIPESAQRPGT